MLASPAATDPEMKLEVLLDALLFMVRHSPVPNLGDALIADLHRTTLGDAKRRKIVDDLASRLRERDEFIDENDA
ncbi:hypothetical protein [Lichenifustis flavocetrariae]|uniref:Uncharacterized protein n=1 Tax=Lichenifustis flavocetrariae TaxID=2949735 RepID=A0AA41Z4Y5_9HYPH|nr:hypothetical protein [Lichenifustis flavocetrariae]MCW6509357.1 hypothetical protein [Lichenifustis flavocetrariae]